jgi:hypothetical protein
LNMSATAIPSPCRITNIDLNDVMILPHDANLCRTEFSERTGPGAMTGETAETLRVQSSR